MISITVLYLGAPTEPFYKSAVEEYRKRLSRFCKFSEICLRPAALPSKPSKAEIQKALADERKLVEEKIPKGAYRIAMCVEGKQMTSEEFSLLLEKIPLDGFSDIVFIIGSSYGLDGDFKKSCHLRLSMSAMTFIHSLALVMLSEQIYRGFMIANGDTYHK